jgi:hypothetical protein
MNIIFHLFLEEKASRGFKRTELTIPEQPKISPFPMRSVAADNPIFENVKV